MRQRIIEQIEFEKLDSLLEGFNRSTGFVTAILDLEGNVLSKSGWRHICTGFHRVHPETAHKCTVSDTVLANKMSAGEPYHFYRCLNGLVDVAVPLRINGEHIANLFSGQFFFEKPDISYFLTQARQYGFDETKYLEALSQVPVISEEEVKYAMDFLLAMTELFSELTYQKLLQTETTKKIGESEQKYRLLFESNPHPMWVYETKSLRFLEVNAAAVKKYGYSREEFLRMNLTDIRPAEDVPALFENVRNAQEEYSFSGEWIHKNKNGDLFTVEIISHSINFLGKEARLVLANDISERKKAGEQLQKRIEELELFHRLTIDRELKMIELKKEINELLVSSGQNAKYVIVDGSISPRSGKS
ncbi:MAG: PocR ligand-binding domain-containing protein [Ignavibacteriaceae bacterium]|nr:PocR ligand-binding domain-containing protein [Ignavibacteriaceae bacterium]